MHHVVQSILHGSPEAKAEGDVQILQHSRLVARGKYVHGFEGEWLALWCWVGFDDAVVVVHRVKPDAVEEYKKAAYVLFFLSYTDRLKLTCCQSEGYYAAIKEDPELHVKLTGSWETVVGEQDTFCAFMTFACALLDLSSPSQIISSSMRTTMVMTRRCRRSGILM